MIDKHALVFDEDQNGTDTLYRVRCGCGQWDSGWRESQKIAADHALRHVTSQWEDWRD